MLIVEGIIEMIKVVVLLNLEIIVIIKIVPIRIKMIIEKEGMIIKVKKDRE